MRILNEVGILYARKTLGKLHDSTGVDRRVERGLLILCFSGLVVRTIEISDLICVGGMIMMDELGIER